ncbi:hypothetical protein L1887_02183 [Cichorium endivia]|nr:hypothetical protein L1887_02183 [Cichorium endivia]
MSKQIDTGSGKPRSREQKKIHCYGQQHLRTWTETKESKRSDTSMTNFQSNNKRQRGLLVCSGEHLVDVQMLSRDMEGGGEVVDAQMLSRDMEGGGEEMEEGEKGKRDTLFFFSVSDIPKLTE